MKMKIIRAILPILFCFVFVASCAGRRPGVSMRDASYTTTLGLIAVEDFSDKISPFLTRNNFLVEKSENLGHRHHIQTEWKFVPVLDDETELGVSQTRIRLVLMIKSRLKSNDQNMFAQITFRAEQEVLFDEVEEWTRIPLGSLRKQYFQQIADELRLN